MVRADLPDIVLEALQALGGRGTIVQICKHIWEKYESELHKSGDLFYRWQYDMRWAGLQLRKAGKLVAADKAPKGLWVISG